MKKILKILGKSLIGIPIIIFLYELLNLVISIILQQYVRIDGGILQDVIREYLFCEILGYGLGVIIFYINSLKEERDTINKTKKVIEVLGIVLMLMFLAISFLDNDIVMGLIIMASICLLILLCLFIIFLFDKKDVNNINKKIRQKEEKSETKDI